MARRRGFFSKFCGCNVIATVVIGIISTTAVLVIGRNSNKLLKEQFKQSEKQHQVHGLLEAFRLLDTNEHRKSRRNVFKLYFDYLDTKKLESFHVSPMDSADIATVRNDFDVLGKLVMTDNIPKEDFLEMYGALAYRCWKCLQDEVKSERNARGFPKFMTYFQQLAKEAYDYWLKQAVDLSKTKLYDPRYPNVWVDFQQDPLVN